MHVKADVVAVGHQGVDVLYVRILVHIEAHSDIVVALCNYLVIEVGSIDILPCIKFYVKHAGALRHQEEGGAVILEIILDEHLVYLSTMCRETYTDIVVLEENQLFLAVEGHVVERLGAIHALFDNHLTEGVGCYFQRLRRKLLCLFCRLYPGQGVGHETGSALFLKLFCIVPAEQQQHYADQRKSY